MRICFFIFIFVGCFLYSQNVNGQATLEIVVIDQKKQPLVNHSITIVNNELGLKKNYQTDTNGKVFAISLPTAGAYDIYIASFNKQDKKTSDKFYHPQKRTGILLVSKKTAYIEFIMQDKKVELEEVVVTAVEYQTVNISNAEVSSDLTLKEMKTLPVEGRNITKALYYLPNVTQSTGFFTEAPNVSINSANALYTNYQIDGMDNNEDFLGGQRFTVPVGMTQSITALTNNFSVENGLSSNGIINITSKSGTNQLKGSVFYVIRPGAIIDSPSSYAQRDLSGNPVKDGFQRHQGGFEFGGAIKKDKTFYHLNWEYTLDLKDNILNVPELNVNQIVKGKNSFNFLSGKISHLWNNLWSSTARLNFGLTNIQRQGGGVLGGTTFPSAGSTQVRNAINFTLKNTFQTTNIVYESNFQYARFNWNYANPNNGTSVGVTVRDPSDKVIASIGHPGYTFDEQEHTSIIQQKFIYSGFGSHQFKLGMQVKASNFELFAGGNPMGNYEVKLNQSQLDNLIQSNFGSAFNPSHIPSDVEVTNYQIELRPQSFGETQWISSIYWEDYWSITPFFNLSFGLRYDFDSLSKGGSDTGDYNNIAPRMSLNYQLGEKTSVRGGFGIYYDKIVYALYSDALQFNSNSVTYKTQLEELVRRGILPTSTNIDAITYQGTLNATEKNVSYLKGNSSTALSSQRNSIFQDELRVLNPNGYQNPHSYQWMLGIQQKIGEKTLLNIDFIHNQSYNLFRIKNLNAPATYSYPTDNNGIVIPRSIEDADLTRPLPIQKDSNEIYYTMINGEKVTGIARNILVTESAGKSIYSAINLTLNKKKGEDAFAYKLVYTISKLENNTEDINFRAMDSNNFNNEWGPSINDRTHLINSIFTYYILDNLGITLTGILQSGQPINRIPDAQLYGNTTDLNGDGRSVGSTYVGDSDRSPGETRNSGRLPWAKTFNFKLSYSLGIKNNDLQFDIDVFNIFNAENLTGYSSAVTQSNQIQVAKGFEIKNTAPPRQFQFSLVYSF